MNGYANLIAARLRKLGEEKSTGLLPVSGHGEGAVFFRAGQVVYAESSRTPLPVYRPSGLAALGLAEAASPGPGAPDFGDVPGPGAAAGPEAGRGPGYERGPGHPDGPGGQGYQSGRGYPSGAGYPDGQGHQGEAGYPGGPGAPDGRGDQIGRAELVVTRSVSRLAGTLVVTEAVIDAVTDLLSSESRYGKFRQTEDLPPAQTRPIEVEALLAEVQRRHEVLRQLAPVVTPDTGICRQPGLDSPSVQVSPGQWALLVRAGSPATPRSLAAYLGRSVFGTTLEVHRLIELGLLAVPGRPGAVPGVPEARRPGPTVSFIRAVSAERGSDG